MRKRLSEIQDKLYTTNEYGVTYQDPDAKLPPEDIQYMSDNFKINTDVHRTCINCQSRQIIKYMDEAKPEENRFKVQCKFIPKSLPAGASKLYKKLVAEGMDKQRARLVIESSVDPVAWASLMFGFKDDDPTWRLRNYQKEQLRCSSEKIVVREGRRSGKTFVSALKLIYLAFNKQVQKGSNSSGEALYSGPTILIVTPFQSQLLNIFDEIESIIKRNADLSKQVTTGSGGGLYVKSPFFRMDMSNGAIIKGFVSGVSSKGDGSGGGSLRGQNAHIVYVDEMDMVLEETLDKVVIPILLTDALGDITFIATSTPIGKRGRFYNWCLESKDWKEDFLPSTVLPQWEKNKATFENEGTEESFKAEYMALFIDGAHGVFKPSYVYRCRKDYDYSDVNSVKWWRDFAQVPEPDRMITCIGIDWNKNAGTEYVVVKYDPNSHKFVIVEVVNITASEFSSSKWKEEVVRLNYKWRPNYIYADEGYGHTIIEDLKVMSHDVAAGPKKTARDVETAKLKDRLVSFNFSSKVELRSPVDGTIISKTGKDFIVEYAVRILEDGVLWFPESEEQLKREMLNYVILRRSASTNKPVYGAENSGIGDHRLDALMLALGGIQLESGLYSANQLAFSTPRFLSKETLEERNSRNGQTEEEAISTMLDKVKMTAPTALEFLKISRPGDAPKPHDGSSVGIIPRSRGSMGKLSVMEYVKNKASDFRGYANDTEHKFRGSFDAVGRKRNRSRTNKAGSKGIFKRRRS